MSRGRTLPVAAALSLVGLAAYLGFFLDRSDSAPWKLVDQYCIGCHNGGEYAGELSFEGLSPDEIYADAEVWEAAVRKLRGGMMPPPGEPRPEDDRLGDLVAWLEFELDAAAAANPNPGAPALHRMNRAEYANAVRDLLAIPLDPTMLLPADDSSEGFDNIANALSVSPAHMQAYVSAAAKISRLAVGDPTVSAAMSTYRAARGIQQSEHIEGLPLGTRGGLLVEHVFPLEAEYEISVSRPQGGLFLPTVGGTEDLEITLNGERLGLIPAGEPAQFRVRLPAGPQSIGAALVVNGQPRGVDDLYSVWAGSTGVQSLSIMGPFDASGPGDTPSRRKIFICRPAAASEEESCAAEILSALASRAFRRFVGPTDSALDTIMTFYESGYALRGFESGIQYALARILVDPRFIYRFEQEPEGIAEGTVYELGDYELASRLSFFLWSSIPDDELLSIAARGELTDETTLAAQAARMLADPKAKALVENFAAQWLLLRQLDSVNPASNDFDGTLRRSMRRETELLFATVLREDRPVFELLNADYTYVDERLARHYGIPNIRGSHFRRVTLDDAVRRGLLGHGSILTVTSAPNRTSPVSRGSWILENVLGTPAPAPPPGIETNLDEPVGSARAVSTVRERLERHREDPGCAACHSLIDPIGFALENFDAVGKWREVDGADAIDASAVLWDGTKVDGPAELRSVLLDRRDAFVRVFTEKLLTYALGRAVGHYDMPVVRSIVRDAAADGYRISSLVLGIVMSAPFRMKLKEPATVTEAAAATLRGGE